MVLKNLAFKNFTLIDGVKDHEPVQQAEMLIEYTSSNGFSQGYIKEIGDQQSKPVIIDADQVIDLRGGYLLPGLINAHCHIMGDGKPKMSLSGNKIKVLFWFAGTALGRMLFLKMMQRNVQNACFAGVTTLRSLGEPYHYDLMIKKRLEEGRFTGPRLLVSGPGILPTGGHGAGFFRTADGPWEMRKAVRENIYAGVDGIKILSTGGVSDSKVIGEAGRPQMDPQEIEAACMEAHRAGMLVASHVQSTQGMRDALLGGVDTIEHGAPITDDLVPLFHKNPRTFRGYSAMTPTFSAPHGINDHVNDGLLQLTPVQVENSKLILEGMIKGYQRALKEGIKLGVGSDASIPYVTHYNFWKELVYLKEYGSLTNLQVIHMATLNNAEILGIEKITGSLEAGKSADFLVVEKNPLEDLANLAFPWLVCAQGRIIQNPILRKVKYVD